MSFADVLTPTLSRLQARYEQSPLPRFLAWWFGELRGLLPARWRERLAVQEAELWLHLQDDRLALCRVVERQVEAFEELPLEPKSELLERVEAALGERRVGLRRVLLLAPTQVLRRRLTLPPVARDKLRTMLAFELDRQTPFRAEQVYYDARVLPHPADVRQVPVELALVQRDTLEQQMQRLGSLASAIDAVDVRDGESRLGCNFLPLERRRRRDRRGRWVTLGLLAGSVLLLMLAMVQLVDNRRAAVAELQAALDEQRNAARGVGELRKRLDDAAAAANFLAVQKQQQPSMVETLNELSRVLPDDTYLERLHTSNGTVTLTGLSEQAAGLIVKLQESPMLRNPALAGSINPDPRIGKDRFTITAEIGPVQEKAK